MARASLVEQGELGGEFLERKDLSFFLLRVSPLLIFVLMSAQYPICCCMDLSSIFIFLHKPA